MSASDFACRPLGKPSLFRPRTSSHVYLNTPRCGHLQTLSSRCPIHAVSRPLGLGTGRHGGVAVRASNQVDKLEKRYKSGIFARSVKEQEELKKALRQGNQPPPDGAQVPDGSEAEGDVTTEAGPLLGTHELLDNIERIDAAPRYVSDKADQSPEIPGTRIITDPDELHAIGQGLPIMHGEDWPGVYWKAVKALGKNQAVEVRFFLVRRAIESAPHGGLYRTHMPGSTTNAASDV